MRTLILYSSEGRVPALANSLAKELEGYNVSVQLLQAEERGTAPIPCGQYDVVCVGSPVKGLFGGKLAADIDLSVKRCTRLEGRLAAAFVQPAVLGTTKALRDLMNLLEAQGAWVQDFAALSGQSELKQFAKRLSELKR